MSVHGWTNQIKANGRCSVKIFSLFLFLFIFMVGFQASAQEAAATQLIVRLEEGQNPFQLRMMGYENIEVLIPEMNLYSVEIPPAVLQQFSAQSLVLDLRHTGGVMYAQENHAVSLRAVPNDKKFSTQWDMEGGGWGINAVEAWSNYGTGGKDSRGSDIVAAVVDSGVDVNHEDLKENIWINKGEIAGNNKDDDNNGYVDDVYGWNAFNNTGKVTSSSHGTHVAGTIGAVGNNKIHGAGVNWKVKLMPINGSSRDTATVLKAYGYLIAQKKLWLQSAGKSGANIVVNNSSFGVDYGNCKSSNYKAWNDVFNEMGKYGILTAGATANQSVDVDRQGDVPTGCDSPYLISVTNTRKDGKLEGGSGWGRTMIDLAAPGTNIYSTVPTNSWSINSGTSMATPHVAGAVAYMHSVASRKFNDLYYADPAAASLELKKMILETVTANSDLKGKTVSGGVLNLNSAAAAISKF